MVRSLRFRLHCALPLGLAALAGACGNAGDGLGIKLPASQGIVAQLFVDRDFNGVFSVQDTVVAGLRVYLLVAGGQGDTVAVDTTDAAGQVAYPNPPLGRYAVSVDSVPALGDSLFTFLTPATVQVAAGTPTQIFAIRLGFPTDDITGVRGSAAGRRVVTSGIVLAGRQSNSDSSTFLRDGSGSLRLTSSAVLVGNFVAPGDSVRVLGTVAMRSGQPVLDAARIVLLQPGLTLPAPDTVTTQQAAGALGGLRDADLVRIQAALVTDSSTLAGHYQVTVDDGSGPVDVVLDSILGLPPTVLVPGDSLRVNGVLVPTGSGSWRVKPRAGTDLTVY